MGDERSGADISAKIAGQELNVKNVKSLNTVLTMLTLCMTVAISVFLWDHADGAEKSQAALIKEVKDGNAQQLRAQNNIAFYQCRSSCLAEQPPDRRDGASCDRICAHLRP